MDKYNILAKLSIKSKLDRILFLLDQLNVLKEGLKKNHHQFLLKNKIGWERVYVNRNWKNHFLNGSDLKEGNCWSFDC